jgi:para-nitrobenzyl esterase
MKTKRVSRPGTFTNNRLIHAAFFVATVFILLNSSLAVGADNQPNLIRDTGYGQIEGRVDKGTGSLTWKGVPFAEPPVGELRFRAPQSPDRWEGVLKTRRDAKKCIQRGSSGTVTGKEDCLYLNIFRPDTEENNLPVYVWIHGGSNSTGKAAGNNMANFVKEANVVAVVIQYRLGPLGFFKHDALATGDPLGDSGNFGILDQIKALIWVQNNISSFGGDFNNVIIAGESAGAHDILALLTIKKVENLFHKVIYESGGMATMSLPKAKKQSAGYVEGLKLKKTGAELAKELRSIEAKRLLKAIPKGTRFGVIADGNLIEDNLFCLVKQGKYKKVPILMGANRNEYSLWMLLAKGPKGKWAKLWTTLPKWGKKKVSEILNEEEKKTFALSSSITGRLWQAQHAHSVARSMRQYQGNIFVYDFQWGGTKGSDVEFIFGAAHANEIAYFNFGGTFDLWGQNTSITEENKPARQALAKAMLTYQAQFMHLGTPNGGAKLPRWKVWSNEKDGVKAMNLDASSEPGSVELKLFMTKREYIQANLIREIAELKDKTAQEWSRKVAGRALTILECE